MIKTNEITSYVYCTLNTQNNKIYVGIHKTHSEEFAYDYLGSGSYFNRAILKHSSTMFIKCILVTCENIDDALNYEKQIMSTEFTSYALKSNLGYNLKAGGHGMWPTNVKRLTNGDVDILVHKKLVDEYINNGWIVGSHYVPNARGSRWMTNGHTERMAHEHEIKKLVDNGWTFGRKTTSSRAFSTGRWMNKNKKNVRIHEEEVNLYLSKGWLLGQYRAETTHHARGTKWIHNTLTGETKMICETQLDKWLNKGHWSKGRKECVN